MFKTIEKYALEMVLWAGVATFAAMVTMPLYSAKADVSHCGVNESRMNPTELSDYQECWLDVYEMDQDHGVVGSLLWVRVNGEYYSTQLRNLRTESAVEAWLMDISTDIITDAVVSELDTKLDAAIEEGDVEAIRVIYEAKALTDEEIAEAIEDGMITDGEVQEKFLDAWFGHETSYVGYRGGDVYGNNFNADADVFMTATFVKTKINGKTVSGISSVTIHTVDFGYMTIDVDQSKIGIVGDADAFGELLTELYDAGYADGYAEGYEDGYNAGYADGFADGVASMS